MAVMWDVRNDARVRREATALARAGHDVRVVAFDYGVEQPTMREDAGVSFTLLPFPSRDRSRIRRLLGAIRFLARASREILRTDADVIHSHNLHLAVPCLFSARKHHATLVYDAHELVSATGGPLARAVTVPYERFIWRRASAVITTNESRATYLEQLHGPRPIVLGNYPDDPEGARPFDLRERLKIPADAPLLIYQGGFYLERRCFDTVATALRALPEWHWALVGFGSAKAIQRLRHHLRAEGVENRVHLLPSVPAQQLLHVTAGADVGIVPLRPVELNNYLGDTNKLFEYLFVGVPAVGSDFPEVRRALVENPLGPVGALFDPESPESIAMAIRAVERDLPALRARAQRVGQELFSWRREQAKLLELYDDLSSRRAANA